MKVVFNSMYGGFRWPNEIYKKFNIGKYEDRNSERTNPDIIEALEAYLATNPDCDLRVADIPDEATDWMITEYDGNETVYCVINGKLYRWVEDYYDDDALESFVLEPVNEEG